METERCTDGKMDRHTDIPQTYRYTTDKDRLADRKTYRQADEKQKDRYNIYTTQTDKLTERQTNRHTDRQADNIHVNIMYNVSYYYHMSCLKYHMKYF